MIVTDGSLVSHDENVRPVHGTVDSERKRADDGRVVFSTRPEDVPAPLRDLRMRKILKAAEAGILFEDMRRALGVNGPMMRDMLETLTLKREIVMVKDLKAGTSTLWTPEAWERESRNREREVQRAVRQEAAELAAHPARRLSEI